MTKEQKAIRRILVRAINSFNSHEKYLIENNLCEQCICAKFAMHIEKMLRRSSSFKDYTTDVEYDRGMGGNDAGKKMLNGHFAYLDLVVHKRGYSHVMGYDNLFAIEMKKKDRNFDSDKERLKILVNNDYGFCYKAGFAIIIIADKVSNRYELAIDENGEFYNAADDCILPISDW